MKRLIEALGVDYVQWRALSSLYRLLEGSVLLGDVNDPQILRLARAAFKIGILILAVGGSPAAILWLSPDLFFGEIVLMTSVIALVGAMSMTQGSLIVAPDDFAIIGFRPVTSRTYFFVRATGLIRQAGALAIGAGALPVVALLTRAGGSWRMALAGAVAVIAGGLTTAGAVVVMYGWLVQHVRPSRLSRAVAYAQMAAILVWTGCYIGGVMYPISAAGFSGASDLPDFSALPAVTIPRHWLMLLYPGTWFAAYIDLAAGFLTRFSLIGSAMSLAAIGLLLLRLRGKLSLNYALRMAQITVDTAASAGPRRRWAFLKSERRVVFTLVRSQLRDDMSLQMGLLMPLLMAGVFFAVGMFSQDMMPSDPFLPGGRFDVIACMVIPNLSGGLFDSLTRSSAYEASWLFFTTPADRTKLIAFTRDAIGLFLLAPILLGLAAWYAYLFNHVGHALLHATVIGAICYAQLQVRVLLTPKLLFSLPSVPGKGGFSIGQSILAAISTMAVLTVFQFTLYSNPLRLAVGLAALVSLMFWLNRLTRQRIEDRSRALVYAG